MVCIAMPKKDRLTENLEAALDAARAAEELAAKERQAIENLLRTRGILPDKTGKAAIRTRGAAPKGRVSMIDAVMAAIAEHGPLKRSELLQLIWEYGAHSGSKNPANVLDTKLRQAIEAGKLVRNQGRYGEPDPEE